MPIMDNLAFKSSKEEIFLLLKSNELLFIGVIYHPSLWLYLDVALLIKYSQFLMKRQSF